MKIEVTTLSLNSIKESAVVLPLFASDKAFPKAYQSVDLALKKTLSSLLKQKVFKAKKGEVVMIPTHGLLPTTYVGLLGLGDEKKCNCETVRYAMGALSRAAESHQLPELVIAADVLIGLDLFEVGKAIAEGLVLGSFKLSGYTQDATPKPVFIKASVGFSEKVKSTFKEGIAQGIVVGEAVNLSRDLSNAPANDLTPAAYVRKIQQLFNSRSPVKVQVIDAKAAKKLGMNLFLGVAQGSVEPPYMVVMSYSPLKGKKPVALVGKGVTFDSGGISIKPSAKMSEMKGDMSGSAAVVATMWAIDRLRPSCNVMAVVALTENMPSGTAQRPGDVVRAANGKTVEIINTDAEGRLVLADALHYVVTKGVSEIVDVATLTGACSVALGDQASAILGNDQSLVDKWLSLAAHTGERLWQLPLYDEYLDYLNSEIADLANASEGRLGGTCSGAKFLEQFVGQTPWVHLDIASMMHYSKPSGYTIRGMSGVGVRNLVAYVLSSHKG